MLGSNNTNKFSPQELDDDDNILAESSNNTNKFSPQELQLFKPFSYSVQIIQINSVLKNLFHHINYNLTFK